MQRILPALAVLLLATPAAGQHYDKSQLAKVEAVYVNVVDGVKEGV